MLRAVDVLGYMPNSTAKNLRTARTGKLLVTVPDISNPFFSLILQGIEDAAQREDYAVLFGDTQHDDGREQRYALMLKSKEADGLIFLGHRLPEAAAALAKAAAPRCAPIVNGCEFNPRLGVPSVHIDNARAASDVDAPALRSRPRAHRRRHRAAGQSAQPRPPARRVDDGDRSAAATSCSWSTATSRSSPASLRRSGPAAGARPPTAIFCFNDEMAIGVLDFARAEAAQRAARSLGRRLRRHPLRALHSNRR